MVNIFTFPHEGNQKGDHGRWLFTLAIRFEKLGHSIENISDSHRMAQVLHIPFQEEAKALDHCCWFKYFTYILSFALSGSPEVAD